MSVKRYHVFPVKTSDPYTNVHTLCAEDNTLVYMLSRSRCYMVNSEHLRIEWRPICVCIVVVHILMCAQVLKMRALFVYIRGCSQTFKDSEFPFTRCQTYFYLILWILFQVNLHLIENFKIYYFIKASIYSKLNLNIQSS